MFWIQMRDSHNGELMESTSRTMSAIDAVDGSSTGNTCSKKLF
jgi:hypothetical protein